MFNKQTKRLLPLQRSAVATWTGAPKRTAVFNNLRSYSNTASTDKKEANKTSIEDKWAALAFKPHVDIADIAERVEVYEKNTKDREMEHNVNVRKVAEDYTKLIKMKIHLDKLRHVRNSVAFLLGVVMASSKVQKRPQTNKEGIQESAAAPAVDAQKLEQITKLKTTLKKDLEQYNIKESEAINLLTTHLQAAVEATAADKEVMQQAGKLLKEEMTAIETNTAVLNDQVLDEAIKVPNLSHPSVPVGAEPKLIAEVGKMPSLPKVRSHDEIAKLLDLIDFESAAFCAGSRFYFLKNELVLLEQALVNYTLNKLRSKGFTPLIVPELIRPKIVEACGFQPRGEASQIYPIEGADLCLVGTSEMSIAGMHANKILPENNLPLKYVGVSHCFRREVSNKASESGLYRVHQFTKVEMFVFCKPEDSEKYYEEIVGIEKEIFTELGFHFKMLVMPTGDLGASASIKTDIEAFMPAKGDYGEVSSASNCTDFQARRLFTRYKTEKGTNYVHTLNGTAVATPRAMITIMEMNQYTTEDGRVGFTIPEVLRPFMGGIEKVEQKK